MMTVPVLATSGSYVSDGSLTARAIAFPFLAAADIIVTVDAVTRVLNTHYQISGAYPAATLVPLTGFATNGQKVRYHRQTALKQDYSISGNSINAKSLETSLDRSVLVAQELSDGLDDTTGRALRTPLGESALPVASLTAAEGKVLGVVDGQITPVANDAVAIASDVARAEAAGDRSTAQAVIATAEANISTDNATQTALDVTSADLFYQQTLAAAVAAGRKDIAYTPTGFSGSSANTVPLGVKAITITTPGSGGTNGTGYAGGTTGTPPAGFAWTYDIVGGAASNPVIVNKGEASAIGTFALTLPNGSLAGTPAATATTGSAIADNATYLTPAATAGYVAVWKKAAGSTVPVSFNDQFGTQVLIPLKGTTDAVIASAIGKKNYIAPLKPATYPNAVRNRFSSTAAWTSITGGNVTLPAIALAYEAALWTGFQEPNGIRVSGTASAAGTSPRGSVAITVADLALAGLVPSDSSPPHFSAMAAIERASLTNQTIDATVSGTSFLNGFWQVMLRYAGAGASLAGPANAATDVIFIGTAITPSSGIGIGSGDSLWSGSTGAQQLTTAEKIMKRENVPLRATYGGQALSGIILYFVGQATAAGATGYTIGRTALISGTSIDTTLSYQNTPEDDVSQVDARNLSPSLQTQLAQIAADAIEKAVASRLAASLGYNPAAWADGMDAAWDFVNGLKYGTAADPLDTHANPIVIRNASHYPVTKAAAIVSQEFGVGLQVVPGQAQLFEDPTNIGAYMATVAGTGSIAQDRRDPAGVANQAWTLTDSSATDSYQRQRSFTVANDSNTHVASIFIRKTESAPTVWPSILLGYAGGTGISTRVTLDTQTGELTKTNTTATWWTEDWGEFWRVIGTMANNSTGNTVFFLVLQPAYASSLTTTNDVSAQGSTVFAWPNHAVGTLPVPPILSNITAGENIAAISQSAYVGQAVAGLITVDVKDRGTGNIRLFALDDVTTSNYLAVQYAAGRMTLVLMAGGASQAAVDIGPWRTGRQTIAFVAGTNYVWGQLVRGLAIAADTSATLPSLNTACLGGLSGSTADRRASVIVEKLALRYGRADADIAASMYRRAVNAHGVEPTFWDAFDRADGAPGTAATGQTYSQVAASGSKVLATISGKKLVAADSGFSTTAAYTAIDNGKTITRMRARILFGAGTDGGGIALIVTNTLDTADINHIVVDGSIHIVFTNTQVNVGFYKANVLTNIKLLVYPTALAKDGTVYEVGYDLSGNTATFHVPGMAPLKLTDPQFLTLAGRYATFEHFWGTGQCQAQFLGVEVS